METENRFGIFDKSKFPHIYVDFKDNIYKDIEYDNFEKDWLSCYEKNEKFIFIFDTSPVGIVPMKYSYKLTNFIKELKKLNNGLLKYSIIIVNSWYIRQLLKLIFTIQKPIATVYIVEKNQDYSISHLMERIEAGYKINDPIVSNIILSN